MKIIQAMKTVKANQEKVVDLRRKISENSAYLSHETPPYADTKAKVAGWAQACEDLSQENVRLLVAIQRTNLATPVTITLGDKQVTKTIAEWVWRRRTYAKEDMTTYMQMTDRGLKEGVLPSTTGAEKVEIKIVRNFNPETRDAKIAQYRQEPHVIDSTLEVVNATTDLLEV